MFCTFVSLEWKTILLQSTLPTRWPSLDSGSMHRSQWRWRVSVDIEDREGMVRSCPRQPNCPRDGANTSNSSVTLIWSPASLISPTQHTTNKANASIYCLNLPSCSEVHWGSEIPTSESKQRTLSQARYVAFWAVLAECWPLILILSPLVPVCRRAAAPGRAELG